MERRVSEIPRYGNVGSFDKRGKTMKKTFFAAFAALICLAVSANDNGGIPNTFEKPAFDALKTLKATVGKPFSAGYVFVDGHYITPPYTDQRYGTVIRINGVQVTGEIVPWSDFVMTQSGAKAVKSESAPAAETQVETPAAEPEEPAEEPEEIGDDESSLDDLFADEPAEKKTRPAARKRVVRRPKLQQPVVKTTYSFEGEFKHNARTQAYLKKINAARAQIERNLRGGGYYFFGSRYKAVVGNARTSKYVINKLPTVMKNYSNPDDFANALRSAGLSYLPVPLMEDLFRNRIGYIMLERRIKADNSGNEWINGL